MFEQLFEATPDASLLVDQQGVIVLANHQAEVSFGYRRDELIGQPIEILIPQDFREKHVKHRSQFNQEPRKRPMGLGLTLYGQRKNGTRFPADITLSPIATENGTLTLCLIHDTTLHQANQQALLEQTRLVRLLQDIATATNDADTIEQAFQYAVDRLCGFLNWPVGHALLFTKSNNGIASTGIWASKMPQKFYPFRDATQAIHFQVGEGLPGLVYESNKPVWITHPADRPNIIRRNEFKQAGLQTALAMQVVIGKKVIAILEFFSEQVIEPRNDLLAVLPNIGAQLGRIIERIQIHAELDEMKHMLIDSVETERIRLAQQIHDGPLQDLYGVFYQMQEIKNQLADQDTLQMADSALQTVHKVNDTLRFICSELRPTGLIHLGLNNAIRSHLNRLHDENPNLEIHLELTDDSQAFDPQLSLVLFRIYQNLISNVTRHAQARHVWVRLFSQDNRVILEVQDNGKGFERPDNWLDLVRQGRVGLAATIERTEAVHGSIDIKTQVNVGTAVKVLVPRSTENLDTSI